MRTWFGGASQGGRGRRAGRALRGREAAGLGPEVRPDPQPLGHFDMVGGVDVVKHAAAGQLHLRRNTHTRTHTDQKQTLRAQMSSERAHTPLYTRGKKNQYTFRHKNESTALGYNSTRSVEVVRHSRTHTHTRTKTHAHTLRAGLRGPSDYSIAQIKPGEIKINCIC